MANVKTIFHSLYDRIIDYNLFIPNEDDYDDEPQDPINALKHQKYSTRLYILLLIVCMYILFYTTITKRQARTVIIVDIDLDKFEKLSKQYNELLSCPCSTITTSYKTFVHNNIQFHPVCSSLFITQQWIEGLYLTNRSSYGVADFRMTASSQFQLLSSLCELSQISLLKNEMKLNNIKILSINLRSKSDVQSEINANIDFFKISLSTTFNSFVNYFRVVIQANNFVTALETNVKLSFWSTYEEIFPFTYFVSYYQDEYTSNENQMISCGITHSTSTTALYSFSSDNEFVSNTYWMKPSENSTLINGFYTGCSAFEALLKSTLDCLYEIDCLQLFNNHFSNLNQMNLNYTNYVLRSDKTNLTVKNHISNIFIDKWITEMNYSSYFHNCNPSMCTYPTTDMINYSYGINVFISLYGGFILILRLISPFFINIILKLKYRRINRISLWIFLKSSSTYLQKLNLFKIADKRREDEIKKQKLITRVYLILLLITIIILLLFDSLRTQIITTSISNPSLNTYIDLQKSYSYTLRCPCSTMTISYQKFLSFSPVFHQICYSDLITNRYLTILKQSATPLTSKDWRNRAYQQFSLLSKLCQLANETITDAINEFFLQSFIVSNMIVEFDFNIQMNEILDQLYQSTIVYFHHLVDMIDLQIHADQPFMTPFTEHGYDLDSYFVKIIETNNINNQRLIELTVPSTHIEDIVSQQTKCICSSTSHCQIASAIFNVDLAEIYSDLTNYNVSYIVPGSLVGCSKLDSLFLSTLDCFYLNSSCFPILIEYIKQTYIWNVEVSQWFDINPLVYNSNLTRFERNSSISIIVKEIMIEQWNPIYFYETVYHLCSPSSCIYSERIYTNNTIGLIVLLLSMIGGLIVSLHFITPYLVILFIKLISRKTEERTQLTQIQEQQTNSCLNQLIIIKQKTIKLLYDTLINLNIFSRQNFNHNSDQMIVKQLGKQATRLYLILLIISFVILSIYSIIQEQILTKDFNEPSFDDYNQLIKTFGKTLTCSCSSITSTYNQFVNIEPIFHPICSNSLISNETINNFAQSLSSNLSIYEKRDYRRLILPYLKYLSELCRISIQSVKNTIKQFLSTSLIRKELLSQQDFLEHIESLIEQTEHSAPNSLNFILSLIRNINFGNAIISTYGTNFQYIASWNDDTGGDFSLEAEIYDNNCSCALQINCTSQAYFIDMNTLKHISIKGLKIGCTPSESFLSSTLQCFYDQLCLNIIKKYTNYSYNLEPLLLLTINQSQTNNELLQNLFINQWITTKNYSSYYYQCLPSLCSFNYIQKFNFIYIISFLLGLQGGLTIVFKWISPQIVEFIFKIKSNRKHQIRIHSESSIGRISTTTTINSHFRISKIILTCTFIILVIITLTLFSIYSIHQENNPKTQIDLQSTVFFTTTAQTNVNMNTTTQKILGFCQLKFERKTIFISESDYHLTSPFIADFNNDNQSDIGYITVHSSDINRTIISYLYILFGYGNGTFDLPIISLLGYFDVLIRLSVVDFNHDNLLDIILANEIENSVHILLGNGYGTFQTGSILFIEDCGFIMDIFVDDFDNDTHLDIAVACMSSDTFSIYFGNNDETFSKEIIFYNRNYRTIWSISVADFNGDSNLDIAIINSHDRTIGVFLGYGNGSFDIQKSSFTGGGVNPLYIVVGDFNEDGKQDIVVTSQYTYSIGVMFGYGNGTFSERIRLVLNTGLSYHPVLVQDFNRDNHLDIAIVTDFLTSIIIYFGNGKGTFEMYEMFLTSNDNINSLIISNDLNNDGYQDIIGTFHFTLDIFLNTGQCENLSEI